MPLPIDLLLSTLQPLPAYLAQGADIDSELMGALEAELPKKEVDKLVKLLDKLLRDPMLSRFTRPPHLPVRRK